LNADHLKPGLPSTLYRTSYVERINDTVVTRDEIGSGPLYKMMRIALSDPDMEVWRYSISVAGRTLAGREIEKIAQTLNG
jgi:hypothetical protein